MFSKLEAKDSWKLHIELLKAQLVLQITQIFSLSFELKHMSTLSFLEKKKPQLRVHDSSLYD
jgi:hypothetical protein